MLSRLALRGALVALLIGGATALAGIALMARTGLPGAAGLRAALVAAGGYLVVFTTARYQAALVVAANAVLDHRAITRRRALAMAGGRWKDLMIWSVVTVAPEPLRQIVSQADTPSSRLTSPAPAGSERREPAPLAARRSERVMNIGGSFDRSGVDMPAQETIPFLVMDHQSCDKPSVMEYQLQS